MRVSRTQRDTSWHALVFMFAVDCTHNVAIAQAQLHKYNQHRHKGHVMDRLGQVHEALPHMAFISR